MWICMWQDHIHILKILWSMSEFDGLWQHQNHVSLQTVKVGHYTKKKRKKRAHIVTLTMKIAKQYFYMTLWLMMMHHHTTSGYKSLNVLEISTGHWKTFTVTLTLNTAIFSQDTPAWWWYTIHCQSHCIGSSEDMIEIVMLWVQEWPWQSRLW